MVERVPSGDPVRRPDCNPLRNLARLAVFRSTTMDGI
jgi:hypothetical protein